MLDYISIIYSPFHSFAEISQRIYWVFLWSALIIAVLAYTYYRFTGSLEKKGLFKYIFPLKIYSHRSAINDYLFFYANFLFQAAFIIPLFATGMLIVSSYINELFTTNFETFHGLIDINSTSKGLLITFILVLVADFCLFLSHYLQHKIPWLWEFHKVHHSAEVLTPITVFRMHPVDNILTFATNTLILGFFFGLFSFFASSQLIFFHINGVNIFFIGFYLLGYNLRHSHIWVHYGYFMSHVFISPAQHQIHHSTAPKHFDKNIGFIFSFWDQLFNTLYIPKQKENIVFGLGEQENNKFSTFWSLYLMPFINLFNQFKINMLWEPKRLLSVLIFFAIVIPSIYLNNAGNTIEPIKSSVFLQDMTWKEIDHALNSGFTTIIIPTGGTEQNGPHVILGKHNYIVKYTAGRVAEKIGKALVTPVITYVPEGSISPAEGHMKFAGTLSISNTEFRNVLESTARSLKQHGFKTIAFLGDSGGNQDDQAFVADKLSTLWKRENVKVIHINNYYQNNKQMSYLMNNGYSIAQIGSHAGIRDTSEIMAVSPASVREDKRLNYISTNFDATGSNGDSSKASVFLGEQLLNLKITAAVEQITAITAENLSPEF